MTKKLLESSHVRSVRLNMCKAWIVLFVCKVRQHQAQKGASHNVMPMVCLTFSEELEEHG